MSLATQFFFPCVVEVDHFLYLSRSLLCKEQICKVGIFSQLCILRLLCISTQSHSDLFCLVVWTPYPGPSACQASSPSFSYPPIPQSLSFFCAVLILKELKDNYVGFSQSNMYFWYRFLDVNSLGQSLFLSAQLLTYILSPCVFFFLNFF